jgi:phage regulator Rha-like protein
MKAIEFIYQDTQIHFALSNDKSVMVNATEMANAFNKRTDHFLRSDHAKAFINVLLSTPYGGNKKPLLIDEILFANKKAGTYMHRILALKFAAWLDPAFELWVFSTIDEILFGNYKKHTEAVIDKIQYEKRMDELSGKLLDNPEFEEYLQIQQLIKTTDAEKQKALKAQINQIKFDFSEKK